MPNLLALTPNLTVDVMFAVDQLRPGEVHRTDVVPKMAGGKGINVARVARTLGHHSEVGGFLGGYVGQFAKSQYDADHLIGHYVWYNGETRLSVLINEPDGRSTVFND